MEKWTDAQQTGTYETNSPSHTDSLMFDNQCKRRNWHFTIQCTLSYFFLQYATSAADFHTCDLYRYIYVGIYLFIRELLMVNPVGDFRWF